ncbi:MAG: type II 3-dehydroquinate dehydratase [Gammaproteobacteria bacterium]|nr:MAG: type II 3-dehydroquinate dehydratase [Gammaproteobacteria bacterium]
MANILVLNGPNLNLLGRREPGIYGNTTLEEIMQSLTDAVANSGCAVTHFQSNAEHELIERIHQAGKDKVDYLIVNPGALTHTSIALRDALLGVAIPFIEVHLSNIFAREEFRRHSYISDIAKGVISGLGPEGYRLALQAILKQLQNG